jgi:hypothetical protein
MRLTGHLSLVSGGVLRRVETELPDGAHLESELLFADDSTFREHGTLSFRPGSEIRFQTLGTGQLTPSPNARVRVGSVTWDIDGGSGRFERAYGRITSQFTVGPEGHVDDAQVGLLFLSGRPDEEGAQP